jgi:hypothetical protein
MADEGTFIVYKSGERVATLHPQKRNYSSGQVMTEAALDPGLTRDLYISLGEALDEQGKAWAIRLYHKPFIRFIWLGALLMMAGGFLAASDPQYRRRPQWPRNAPVRRASRSRPLDRPDPADRRVRVARRTAGRRPENRRSQDGTALAADRQTDRPSRCRCWGRKA